jgi:hypothetical protein
LLMLATMGPSRSLSSRTLCQAGSFWNAVHLVSRSASDSHGGDYPALDIRARPWLRWLRQAGALLVCTIAFFGEGHNGTWGRWKYTRIAETEISTIMSIENISVFNTSVHINGPNPCKYIRLFVGGKNATEPQGFINRPTCANCSRADFLESRNNQFFFISNVDYRYLRPTDNVISRSLTKILDSQPDAWHVGSRWILWRKHHAIQNAGNIGENICAQLSPRSDYLPITYPNQTASDNHEKNGGYRSYGPVVVLQEGTQANNEILQSRYFLSGLIFIVGTLTALLFIVYRWWRL